MHQQPWPQLNYFVMHANNVIVPSRVATKQIFARIVVEVYQVVCLKLLIIKPIVFEDYIYYKVVSQNNPK